MADICLVYAHTDAERAFALHRILADHGWDVWWDGRIYQGSYRRHIEQQLSTARCVVPIWSKASIEADWVLDEARFAAESGKPLCPVRIEMVRLPVGFGHWHTTDLLDWSHEPDHPGIHRLVTILEQVLGAEAPQQGALRPPTSEIGGQTLALPLFCASVSSHETQIHPHDAVTVLKLLRYDAILVSAYDTYDNENVGQLIEDLREMRESGTFVVLDSGNYEAYRKRDAKWSQPRFAKAARRTPCDCVFCFDNLRPPKSVDKLVRDVVTRVRRDQDAIRNRLVMPIIHAPTDSAGAYQRDLIPEIILGVAEDLRPPLIVLPERELGDGLLERAKMVAKIRATLNKAGRYQPVHLLGTGNPLSIAILAAAGADAFDGLEWCRTVVDHRTALLHHHQQYDFFRYQSGLLNAPASDVVKAAADSLGVSFIAKLALHNLEFFDFWMTEVRRQVAAGTIGLFLTDWLPKGGYKDLATALPEVFR